MVADPEQYRHHPTWDLLSPAEFYETVRDWDWNDVDGHTPTATMREKEWVTPPPDSHHLAESKSKRLKVDTHTIDIKAFTMSSRTRSDDIAETINLIDETIAMCRDDIPGSISMIVDSGASHVLVRQEHAHVLHNVTCDNSKRYATIKCAKQGAILTAIGMGSLSIGRFRIQAFICRNNESQHSLLGLNPLTAKGCTAEFTNRYFRLNHTACLQSILVGYK